MSRHFISCTAVRLHMDNPVRYHLFWQTKPVFQLDCSNTAYLSICDGVWIQKDCTFSGRHFFLYIDPKWSKLSTITVFVLLCTVDPNEKKKCKSNIDCFNMHLRTVSCIDNTCECTLKAFLVTTYLCKYCTHLHFIYTLHICNQRKSIQMNAYKHVYINPSVHVHL